MKKSQFSSLVIDFGNAKVKLKDQIGCGLFSQVYSTNDAKLVVKVINISEQKGELSYQNEKFAYQVLGQHENIINCLNYKDNLKFKGGSFGCLLLEHCTKGSVAAMLNDKKITLHETKITQILYETLLGLQKIHSLQPAIAHRDLRVESVLLADDGRFKICNFGSMSTTHYDELTSENRYNATDDIETYTRPPYRSPEQTDLYSGYPVNEKVDIWALGIMLFYLCFNQQPFDTKLAILNCKYTVPNNSRYSLALMSLFPKIFVSDPRKRPSVAELLTYMQSITTKGPLEQIPLISNLVNSDLISSEEVLGEVKQTRSLGNYGVLKDSKAPPAKEIKPSFMNKITKFVKLKLAKMEGWILSAVEENEEGPNQKYVRFLIIRSWEKRKKIPKFYLSIGRTLQKNPESTIVTLKVLIVLHNYFKKGPPEALLNPNAEHGPQALLNSLYDIWTKTLKMSTSGSTKDKKRSEYSTLLIINYTDLLIKKLKLNSKYTATFEGNFSLNPFFTNQRENNSPLAVPIFEELLDFWDCINRFSKGLLRNKWLWRIQCSLILSVIDEAYCVFCILFHLITTYKQATNYITVQVDRSAIEKNVRRVEARFDSALKVFQEFIANCSKLSEFNDLQSITHSLSQDISGYIHSIPILQPNKENQEFNLSAFLNSTKSVLGIKLPLSYGAAISDINLDNMLKLEDTVSAGIQKRQLLDIKNQYSLTPTHQQRRHYPGFESFADYEPTARRKTQQEPSIRSQAKELTVKTSRFVPVSDSAFENVFAEGDSKLSTANTGKNSTQIDLFEGFNFSKDPFAANSTAANSNSNSEIAVGDSKIKEIFKIDSNSGSLYKEFSHQAVNSVVFRNSVEEKLSSIPKADPNEIFSPAIISVTKNSKNTFFPVLQKAKLLDDYPGQTYSPVLLTTNDPDLCEDGGRKRSLSSFYAYEGGRKDQNSNIIHPKAASQQINGNNPTSQMAPERDALMGQVNLGLERKESQTDDTFQFFDAKTKEQLLKNLSQKSTLASKAVKKNEASEEVVQIEESATRQQIKVDTATSPKNRVVKEQNLLDLDFEELSNAVKPEENKESPNIVVDCLKQFIAKEVSKSVEDWIINYKTLKLDKKIGSGGSAEVFQGTWRGADVAIKRLKTTATLEDDHIKEFQREIAALVKIRPHPNIVALMGVSESEDSLYIVTEFCHGGTLFEWLHKKKDFQITWPQKIKMAKDIASGMLYLHSCEPAIIHRDLKSLNLLLDTPLEKASDRFTVKIADFGLSKVQDVTEELHMTGMMGTYHWMAPEIFDNKGYTLKADVYSYGIVLWEICTRQTPYQDLNSPAAIMKYVLMENGRPDLTMLTSSCPPELIDLMIRCWDQEPSKRPSFPEILDFLKEVKV